MDIDFIIVIISIKVQLGISASQLTYQQLTLTSQLDNEFVGKVVLEIRVSPDHAYHAYGPSTTIKPWTP